MPTFRTCVSVFGLAVSLPNCIHEDNICGVDLLTSGAFLIMCLTIKNLIFFAPFTL